MAYNQQYYQQSNQQNYNQMPDYGIQNQYQQQQYGTQPSYGQNYQYQPFDTQQPEPSHKHHKEQQQPVYVQNSQGGNTLSDLEFGTRKGFVVKVYSLLVIELGITIGIIYAALYSINFGQSLFHQQINIYCQQNFYGNVNCWESNGYFTWFFWLSFFISIFLHITLFCCMKQARRVPINYVLTLLYVTFFGFVLAACCRSIYVYYPSDGIRYVTMAWIYTGIVVLSLTLYACTTKSDIIMKAGMLFILFPLLITCVFMSIFWYSNILYIIICCLVIIFYGFYLIWETQMIIGGKSIQLSIDDYVVGSLLLYGTIIQMFIRILEIILLARGRR